MIGLVTTFANGIRPGSNDTLLNESDVEGITDSAGIDFKALVADLE